MDTLTNTIIDGAVATERFACDVGRCKGACCTLPGGRGAPLGDGEIAELEKAFAVVRRTLSARSLAVIASEGLYEGVPGNRHTTCVDDKDCVFVVYEEGVARCAVEMSYFRGEIAWRKPISCHLFPIRVSPDGRTIRYERIGECLPGVERGEKENVPLFEFLKEPLVRKFGAGWYEEFSAECRREADGSPSR